MTEKKLAHYETEARRVFSPSPISTYWKYLREEAEIERRIATQRAARLALQNADKPAASADSEIVRNPRLPQRWTDVPSAW